MNGKIIFSIGIIKEERPNILVCPEKSVILQYYSIPQSAL